MTSELIHYGGGWCR